VEELDEDTTLVELDTTFEEDILVEDDDIATALDDMIMCVTYSD